MGWWVGLGWGRAAGCVSWLIGNKDGGGVQYEVDGCDEGLVHIWHYTRLFDIAYQSNLSSILSRSALPSFRQPRRSI